MLIQCTKKLLDELKIKPDVLKEEYKPLFSWHANLLTVNRKKTIVLMNDNNRYIFVLHGLKIKDFKNLDSLIVNAIHNNLLLECIKPDIVDKLIPVDTELIYSKTRNKSMVARLNKSCDAVQILSKDFQANIINQATVGIKASRYLVGTRNGEYIHPHNEMFKDIEKIAETSVFQCKAVEIKATLVLENFEVWRKLKIPVSYTFKQLHDVLQAAFGWKDYHLHEFYLLDGDKPVMNLVCGQDAFEYSNDDIPMQMETDYRLSDFIPQCEEINYIYDFGDNWKHYLKVLNIDQAYSNNYAVCTEGKGNTPPEDVGNEEGYKNFLEAILDHGHEEHDFNVKWGNMQGYSEFEINKINNKMRLLTECFY